MTMKCDYCEIIQDKRHLLYEDKDTVVALKDTALSPGQVTIFPKQHFTILEQVPNDILQRCSALANKIGVAVFESLGCHGTNIIAQNGLAAGQVVPHFALEVVPRMENDNLPLQWQPQQLMEDEIDQTHAILIDQMEKMTKEENKKEVVIPQTKEKINHDNKKDNYLLKSIRRLP